MPEKTVIPMGPEYITVQDTPPRVILARRSPKKPSVYGIVAEFDTAAEAEVLAQRLAELEAKGA